MVRSIHILLLVLIALSAGLPAGMQATPSGWYIVTSTNDSGPGSLRQAIIDANAVPGSDTIDFNIPRSDPGYSPSDDVWTIRPTSLLPSLTGGDMTIRGWTQGENQGDSNGYYPNVRIDGSGLAANAWIFSVESNLNVINELMINYAPGTGIKLISGAAENNITRNFIGIGPDGSSPAGNGTGIEIFGGANDNWIHDNIIGFNERHGIMIAGSGTDNNFIANNWIGLGWNGEARPNGEHGILIMNGASGNGVGSGSWAYSNWIGANLGHGVYVSAANANEVDHNVIGIDLWDPEGIVGAGNGGSGVVIDAGSDGNSIANNVISGNGAHGVHISAANTNNVTTNHIGVDQAGTASVDLGNTRSGVVIDSGAVSTWIADNVISGNDEHGVYIHGSGTDYNYVEGNVIGADVNVAELLPNGKHGVAIYGGAQHNEIGHALLPSKGNVIVGSGWSGVVIADSGSDRNNVSQNAIGTNMTGTATHLGNRYNGVHIAGGSGNEIRLNRIAHNGTQITRPGVRVEGASAIGNTISQNSIHDNSGKGIELVDGGNAGVPAPTITDADCTQVDGATGSNWTIEVFSDRSIQGRWYEGTGTAHWTLPAFSWSGSVRGPNVTVTVTDNQGNTSEFSTPAMGACHRVSLPLVIR